MSVSSAVDLEAFGATLNYNPSCVTFVEVNRGSATESWAGLAGVSNTPGEIRIGGFRGAAAAINGSGQVASITFTCGGGDICACSSNLTLTDLVDGFEGATTTGGTAGCVDTSSVATAIKTYTFDESAEGWTFRTFPGTFGVPQNFSAPGYLLISANNDNTNTYGFFVGPVPSGFDLLPGVPANPAEGPLYLVRSYVRRTTANPARIPEFNVRVNSSDFQDYRKLVVNRQNNGQSAPSVFASEAFDLLFSPGPEIYQMPQAERWYYVNFDLLNFEPQSDANGGFLLDRVEIFAIPRTSEQNLSEIKSWPFTTSGDAAEWIARTYPGIFGVPVTSVVNNKPRIAGPADDEERATSFGSWEIAPANAPTTAFAGDTSNLFVRMTATVNATETNPSLVPQIRLRTAPANFANTSEAGIVPIGSGSFMPSNSIPRTVVSYLRIPKGQTSPMAINGAMDLLIFTSVDDPNLASTNPIILESFTLDLVRINNYPAVLANP